MKRWIEESCGAFPSVLKWTFEVEVEVNEITRTAFSLSSQTPFSLMVKAVGSRFFFQRQSSTMAIMIKHGTTKTSC